MRNKTRAIIDQYDEAARDPLLAEHYGHSGFYNFGYWLPDTRDQRQASETLMEKLLALVPLGSGSILDIACGMGGTTRSLLTRYKPADVAGIDVTRSELRRSVANVPGVAFLEMDATKLAFRDGAFDNIICVEAAFHFDTREDFLRETFRVLRPGGHLLLSDILIQRCVARLNSTAPRRNYVEDLEAYRSAFTRAGLKDLEIVDATNETWKVFSRRSKRWLCTSLLSRKIGLIRGFRALARIFALDLALRQYVLVAARKP